METTRDILIALQAALTKQYEEQLAVLPLKKSVRETLVDGFKDGVRTGIQHTVKMLEVTIKE